MKTQLSKKWACIIPYYNNEPALRLCLDSLPVEMDSIVVDNSNEHHELRLPNNSKLIRTTPELGYGRAVNAGLKYASKRGYEYVLIINQDATVLSFSRTWLEEFLNRHPDSIVSAIAYSTNGKLLDHIANSYGYQFKTDYNNKKLAQSYIVKQVGMPCLAISVKTAIRYGPFDPIFHMYFEDWDLVHRNKGNTYVSTALSIQHDGSGTRNPNYTYELPYLKSEILYYVRYWGLIVSAKRTLHKIKHTIMKKDPKSTLGLIRCYLAAILNLRTIKNINKTAVVAQMIAAKDLKKAGIR